jgi:hypothetical protein
MRTLGSIMKVFGALILGLSGLCTGIGVINGIDEALGGGPYRYGLLEAVLMIGIPFILAGLGLFIWGRSIERRAQAAPDPTEDHRDGSQ